MTDVERLAVAWELWTRRSAALARGMRVGPLVAGAVGTCAMVGGAALKPMVGL